MGEVYVARQRSTGALRALKRLHAHLVADPVMRARFEREAKVVARIESQHVVQVLAAGVDEARGEPFIAMERQRITDLIVATGGLDRFTGRRATGLWHVEFDERGTMATAVTTTSARRSRTASEIDRRCARCAGRGG